MATQIELILNFLVDFEYPEQPFDNQEREQIGLRVQERIRRNAELCAFVNQTFKSVMEGFVETRNQHSFVNALARQENTPNLGPDDDNLSDYDEPDLVSEKFDDEDDYDPLDYSDDEDDLIDEDEEE